MSKTCWVPDCDSKKHKRPRLTEFKNEQPNHKNYKPNSHYFRAPKDPCELARWQAVFPQKKNLKSSHFLCDRHFEETDILKYYFHTINGEEVRLARGKWDLAPGAMPMSDKKSSRALQELLTCTLVNVQSSTVELMTPLETITNLPQSPSENFAILPTATESLWSTASLPIKTYSSNEPKERVLTFDEDYQASPSIKMEPNANVPISPQATETSVLSANNVPIKTYSSDKQKGPKSRFHKDDQAPLHIKTEPYDWSVNTPITLSNLSDFKREESTLITPEQTTSEPTTLHTSKYSFCCNSYCCYKRKVKYLNKRISLKTKIIKDQKAKIKLLTAQNTSLVEEKQKFKALPPKQKLLIKEALRNCTVKSSGRRYSKDWLVDSLLLNIKSASLYNFLRTNEYLPLPSISTLNKNISNLGASFGFDHRIEPISVSSEHDENE